MVKFHGTLSEETVFFRYFAQQKLELRIAHERLTRICFIDYDREMALAAGCDPNGCDPNGCATSQSAPRTEWEVMLTRSQQKFALLATTQASGAWPCVASGQFAIA
jgi:hypothetical protein